MKLYNQISKKVEDFKPLSPENVKIYTCGPTVYNFAHIGNFSSYVYWDLLVRTLTLNGYHVDRILNLTDVGHLTSDADEGEDKLEKGARREGKTVWEIAETYIDAFLKDFRSLNLIEPSKICRATDYIQDDIALVNTLTEKGYTYETSDGIYFDTSKFKDYAKFARLDLDQMRAGARVKFNSEKRNVSDFAVWKFIRDGEDHAMRWDYLGRPGYPGWHLECSTIVHAELGEPIDIHTGGIDHIPVHHTNEIAQSEAAFDVAMSRFWLHCNFLTIDGEKISKSLGNTYLLSDLAARGFTPLDYKMWVLQGHYQGERNFTFDSLSAAKTRLLSWKNRLARAGQEAAVVSPATDVAPTGPAAFANSSAATPAFSQAHALELASNNLNSSEVMAYIDNSELTVKDWAFVEELFGLGLKFTDISDELKAKIAAREEARRKKDFTTADKLRDELARENLTLLDTPTTPLWQYLS